MANIFSSGRLAIAICGRCSLKKPYLTLSSDPNVPGLRVCGDCKDKRDPYRLPPRQPDAFVLRYPRPDVQINDLPNYISTEAGDIIDLTGDDTGGDDFLIP